MKAVTIHYEPRPGFRYPQPVQRLEGKTYFEASDEDRAAWADYFWNGYHVDAAKLAANYTSELWKDDATREYAFEAIYQFKRSGSRGQNGSFTPLFNFEIMLLNDGWKFQSIGQLNAMHPSRVYNKGDKWLAMGFGIETPHRKVNFYFVLPNGGYYQVSNKPEDYQKAINGQLEPIY